jgi:hypothetical protein
MKNSLKYFFIAFLFLVNSCSKDDNNENLSGNNSTVKTTIIGRVFDESGSGLSGADVYIGNKTASTNLWGIYVIEDATVVKSRSIITVKKAGYWDQVGTFKPKSGGTSSSNLCLYTSTNTHSVNALLGGTINTIDGASIQFPIDAFERMDGTSYTGTVALTVHHLPRSADLFSLKAPGTDFKGKSLSNTIENLVSFGMIGATLKDGSGNELKLKTGKKAIISLPVHAAQLAIAPPSIPLWHFNDVTAIWEEEGTALFNGNMYTGEVSHFSWWNCDQPGGVDVSGLVIDCNNNPLADAEIYADGMWGSWSDLNGEWYGVLAPNMNTDLHAEYYDWNGNFYTTSIYTMLAQPNSSTFIVPDFVFPNANCYTLTGNVNKCDGQPSAATVLVILNNNLLAYQFTPTGAFDINVGNIGNVPIQIIAYKGIYTKALTTNYGTGTTLNIGTITLCDTTNLNNNVIMNFVSPVVGNIPISLEVSSCIVNFISGKYEIVMAYTDSASGNSSTFVISTPMYANGTYNWNSTNTSVSGVIFYQGINYFVLPNGSGGSTTLINSPNPGDYVRGTFSGPVLLSGGLTSLTGTLSASFDVYRNN